MKEAQFISEVLVALEVGFDGLSKKKIDEYYKKYDQVFNNSESYFESFNFVMSVIGNLMETPVLNSQFKKQAWFFTLFLSLYDKIYFSPGSAKKDFTSNKIDIEKYRMSLVNLVRNYNAGEVDENIVLLYRQGTGASGNRKQRHQHLLTYSK